MVGYSRLIAVDDAGTLARLKRLRSDLFDPAIDEHRGRVVQSFYYESGDGKRHYCSVGDRGTVRLVRQRSGSPCIEGRTWGRDQNGIWVWNLLSPRSDNYEKNGWLPNRDSPRTSSRRQV